MNFIICEKPVFEVEQRFTFHLGRHGRTYFKGGTLQGNINDIDFAKKLQRWRGRMMVKNVEYWESVSPVTIKEVKRMNDRERYERKMSRLWNEFWRRHDSITGLFADDERGKLFTEWKAAVKVMKERYNQDV